jgi:coiled-coil domain-containing protein 61
MIPHASELADIEDITAKTGNYKKFPVFVKMLLSAVKQASESVFVDLLTYQDLEVLKARKAGNAAAGATQLGTKGVIPSNKRYLILTYAAEFDRVHYPLPLLYEESPDPARLKAIIVGLRAELDSLTQDHTAGRRGPADAAAGAHELRRMREENAALRQQLKHLERAGPGNERLTGESQELARELKLVGGVAHDNVMFTSICKNVQVLSVACTSLAKQEATMLVLAVWVRSGS